MTEGDNGNGRVTLAIIGQKLDEVLRRLDKIEGCINDHEKRIQTDEQGAVRREERISELRQDVDRLQTRDTLGTITATLAAVVAGIVGWIK